MLFVHISILVDFPLGNFGVLIVSDIPLGSADNIGNIVRLAVISAINPRKRVFLSAKPESKRANQLVLSRTAGPEEQDCARGFYRKLFATPGMRCVKYHAHN